MILPADFEARTIETVRRFTDDIAECGAAEISIVFQGSVPTVRFVFGEPHLRGRPALGVQLVTESRKNPLAPGRLVEGDQLRRHVRDSVERYFQLNGLELTRKAMNDARL
jgi:hypothetical protein